MPCHAIACFARFVFPDSRFQTVVAVWRRGHIRPAPSSSSLGSLVRVRVVLGLLDSELQMARDGRSEKPKPTRSRDAKRGRKYAQLSGRHNEVIWKLCPHGTRTRRSIRRGTVTGPYVRCQQRLVAPRRPVIRTLIGQTNPWHPRRWPAASGQQHRRVPRPEIAAVCRASPRASMSYDGRKLVAKACI